MKTSPLKAIQHPGELSLPQKRPSPSVRCLTGTGGALMKLTVLSGGIEDHVKHLAKTPHEMNNQSILQIIR